MKRHLENRTIARNLLTLALVASLVLPLASQAASVALATAPLATSTTSTVKPNVMFILDNSGSMDSDYLPDWASNNNPVTGTQYSTIPALHRNSGFNGVAYNPAITYTPPVLYNADGTLNTTTYPNIGSPWTSVKNDGYNIQDTNSTNLVSAFPDVEWCTSSAYTTCLRNDNLILPGSVGGVNYNTSHSKVSTGSGNVATGSPAAPTTAARSFGPFYYTIVPGEYCDSPNFKNCQTTQTATFSYPASLRWCDSAALTNCQALNSATFQYPRYPTNFNTPAVTTATFTTNPASVSGVNAVTAVTGVTGVNAAGSLTFTNASNISPTGFSIKVNGTEILTSTAPGSQSSSGLASWVASHSSLAGYTITASSSTVTITSTTAVTSTKNITSIVVTSAALPAAATYTTSYVSGAGVVPTNGALVITGVTSKNAATSLKCGAIFIGTSAAYTSVNNASASVRLTELYTKINGTTVNGYSIGCNQSTTPMTCTVTPPAGASACSGGFTLANIATTTNTGPVGGSGTPTAASGSLTFTNAANVSPTGFSVKVNGTEILTSTTPGSQSSTGLATWVKNNSSLAGYTITNPSAGKVTITANTPVATTYNISSIVVAESATTAGSYATVNASVAGVTAVTAVTGVTAVKAAGTITFTNATSVNPAGFSVKVNGTEIMTATTPGAPTSSSGMATWVKNNSSLANYSITNSGSTVTITASANGPAWNISTIAITQSSPSPAAYFGSFIRTDIVSGTSSYPYPGTAAKAPTRTDCAGTTCTYTEEMTNFANWWAYYQTRLQSMKTSVSRAFKTLDNRFRVGFTVISYSGATNGATFLGNNTFELAQKNSWFTKLFAQSSSGSTPLRGALAKAGRYYANKVSGQVDPLQYSCQQNFTIISTDGYWNLGSETSAYRNNNLTGGLVGDMDGGTTTRPMYEGPTASSGSLADIAKFYYDTDLRTSTLGNCAGGTSPDFPAGNPDVCTNNVFVSSSDNNVKQHMTTFTMGLGAEGTMDFTSDYLTATSGDYYNLKNGLGSPTVNWPDPQVASASNSVQERIDDLWHAAVNGQGIYFSAKNPDQIIAGLNTALSSITAKLGSAAAAATSTLNPVAGNNFAYVASYTTVKWIGNLESRSINTATGVVSETAGWCAENVVATTCAAPGAVVTDTSGSSTNYNCVVSGATSATCTAPGVFDSVSSNCTTPIANACTGTMAAKVGATTDTRNIYTAPAGGLVPLTGQNLVPFDAAYAIANPTNFAAAHISTLNQWGALTGTQQTAAAGLNLINYLRGQNGHEFNRTANAAVDQLYRNREAVLGDALESQPAFIGKPVFSYPYAGYSDYVTAQAGRAGTVYMGTNDGMMHAFAASDGKERWAYVPSMVIPNMWKLASTSYSGAHANFANGSAITSDIYCPGTCGGASASWRTILVAGLNGGGRGYYALDITVPATPTLLWEFTPTTGIGAVKNDDVGYSFGQPVITRKADGTWVVMVTSGYNNTSPGDGKGYLFVLDASTGAIISKIATGMGDTTTPSGLAKIAGWNDDPAGNKVGYVYGGDLLGNVWRFDINSSVANGTGVGTVPTGAAMQFAILKDPLGIVQPITTTPVLGKIVEKRVVFIGTGKYLETGDLTTTQKQTQYAIKDDDATTTLVNPRTTLVNQTLTNNPNGTATRLSSGNTVNFLTGRGWYVDFPDGGSGGVGSERVNIDSKLVEGTLLVPTIVPSSTVCSPGGYGWLNFFDYTTGGAITKGNTGTGLASVKYDSTIVGVNVIYIQGAPKVEVVTSTNPTPEIDKNPAFNPTAAGFTGKRVTWRELIQ